MKLLAGQLFNRWIDYHYFALRVNLLINEQKNRHTDNLKGII